MYAKQVSDSVSSSTLVGWTAPDYASSWDDVVRVVYARSNYNLNKKASNVVQREYLTGAIVGTIIDAYRRTRANGTSSGYNPRNTSNFEITIKAVQTQLGRYAPSRDDIKIVLTEFYDAIFGQPQQIPPSWYTAGTTYEALTDKEKSALQANAKTAAQSGADQQGAPKEEQCGIFCTIGNSIKGVFNLPAVLASGVSTTAKIMAVAVPVVLIGGTVGVLYVVGKKVLQLDANKTVETAGNIAASRVPRVGR